MTDPSQSHSHRSIMALATLEGKLYYIYRPKKRPDLELGIYLLKMGDLEIAAHLLAERFSKTEAKYVHLGIPYEDVHKMMLLNVKRSIEDELALCAIDLAKKKIVSVSTTIDLYRERTEPLHLEKLYPKDAQIHKLFEFWEYFALPEEMLPKGPKEFYRGDMGATELEYEQLGITAFFGIMIQFLIPNGHGVILAGNNRSFSLTNSQGGKIIKTLRLQDYTNKKGEKIFAGIDKTCQKLKIESFEYVSLMYFDSRHRNVKPVPKL